MSRKKKSPTIVPNVTISKIGSEGNAIGYLPNEQVVFVPFAAPGDVVDVLLTKRRKSYAQGRIQRIVTPSSLRTTPLCKHFGTCGGCKWQHIPYPLQLEAKQQQVYDQLERIAKIEIFDAKPIIGSEDIWEYRNKLEFTFSNKRWLSEDEIREAQEIANRDALGFHIPGMFDKIIDINTCYLQDSRSNDIRLFIKEWCITHDGYDFFDLRQQTGFMRSLMIRNTSIDEWMVVVVFAYEDSDKTTALLSAIKQKFPFITSLMYVVNTKCNDSFSDLPVHLYSGKDFIMEEMDGLYFKIGPKSFYQTNSKQAYKLYSVVRELAGMSGNELVYDLYTGTGTIASFIAKNAKRVVGIEYVEDAITDAQYNAQHNGLENIKYFAGDMKDVLTNDFIQHHGRPDIIITDPPRAGMHDSVIQVILNAAPQKIVYVSCNPATQARDLLLLTEKYKVMVVQPVDMFPHTHHVENVVLLQRR